MVTWIDQEAPVFPVVPEFDVDLTCVVSTKFEFVFHGDFYPELTSFRGVKNTVGKNFEPFFDIAFIFLSNITKKFKVLKREISRSSQTATSQQPGMALSWTLVSMYSFSQTLL